MAFDFAHPPVSQISDDLDGVAILLWGANGTGKTPLACGMPKPYYLAFEGGLTGIQNVPYAPMKAWKDFLQFVKWATSPASTEEAHRVAQTIILDTVDVMADYCIDYTCSQLGITSLGAKKMGADGKQDFSVNGYTEYAREFKRETRALRNAGFTLVYIAHDGGTREDTDPKTRARYQKMYPSGDKRAIEPICNDVDVIPLYYMQDTALGCWSESDLHDACYLALLFHDCMKLGNVQGDTKDAHTFHTHPLLAADFVEEGLHRFLLEHDFNMSDAMIVREAEKAIQSHMGKWNIARYSSVILPTPESGDWIAKLVHLCDLLASRKQIEYKFDLVDVQAC